ncbi:MAG: AgmX/PglI C-terminal domain-containing protein [Nitrospira sp.]|nr:TonB family protein [Candidatus Manganitrophaceae bacterium]HIL34840.1 TonB family protein [Candidatus Manganitrophaceae bacterium]
MSDLAFREEDLFQKTLRYSLGFYLILSLVVAMVKLPKPKPTDIRDLPRRVTKLILDPPKPVPAPPIRKKIKPKPVVKAKGLAREKPKERPGKKIGKRKIVRKKPPKSTSVQRNREIVRKSGLLAFLVGEELSGSLGAIIEDKRLDKALSQASIISAPIRKGSHRPAVSKSGSSHSKIANKKIEKFGTLKKKDRVRLAKREKVTVTHFSGTGGETGEPGQGLGGGVGVRLRGSGSGRAEIDYDAIARVVEKYKGGLIFLYNRELRSNPILKGTVTVEFSIDEKGKVVEARVVNSSMGYARLEKALARRIKMWKFPELFEGTIIVTCPFVFFPA